MTSPVSFWLPPKFEGLFRPARYKCYYGGRGGAKSVSFAKALIAKAHTSKHLILCTREYQTSILDSVHRLLASQIYVMGLAEWFDIQKTTIVCKTTGSQFIFRGLHNQIGEIKSMHGVNIIWVEEAQSVAEESWLTLDPTIRENNSEVWISFNPDREEDPTYVRFVKNPPPDSIVVKVNWQDNPWWPPVLETQRVNMLSGDPDNYSWVWEGECRQQSDATVFKNKIVVKSFETAPDKTRFYHGLDFGYSVDPTVMIRAWIKPSEEGFGEDLMIDREAYGHAIELDEMGAFFDANIETARFWPIKADSARPETISYLSRQGYSVTAAEKWKGCVEDGIAHLRAFRKIIIHERLCPNTAREFRTYSYKVDKRTLVSGKPTVLPMLEERNDHAPDACIAEMALVKTLRGNIPIKDVVVGDFVRTRKGYHRVYHTQFMGYKEVWRIKAGNSELLATGDHQIFTTRGWTRLDALRYSDEVLVGVDPCDQAKQSLQWNSMVGVTSNMREAITSSLAKLGKFQLSFTEQFGNFIMAPFLMGTMFTTNTRTMIPSTPATLSAFQPSNTNLSMEKKTSKPIKNAHLPTLNKLDHSPSCGMEPKKGASFTEIMAYWYGVSLVQLIKTVSNAISRLRPKLSEMSISSVATPANQLGDEPVESTTKNGPAQSARSRSLPPDTVEWYAAPRHAQCIENTGLILPVYDLSVEREQEFFANGILVHNCRYSLDGMIQMRGGMGIWQRLIRPNR